MYDNVHQKKFWPKPNRFSDVKLVPSALTVGQNLTIAIQSANFYGSSTSYTYDLSIMSHSV